MADKPAPATACITPYNASLAHNKKRGCAVCGSDVFAVEDVTSNAGATEGIFFQCLSCGYTARVTIAAMGATQNYG